MNRAVNDHIFQRVKTTHVGGRGRGGSLKRRTDDYCSTTALAAGGSRSLEVFYITLHTHTRTGKGTGAHTHTRARAHTRTHTQVHAWTHTHYHTHTQND